MRRWVLVLTVAYVAIGWVFSRFVAPLGGIHPDLASGTLFISGLLIGPPAAWGAGFGFTIFDLGTGSFNAHTGFGYLAQFFAVVVGYTLWQNWQSFTTGGPRILQLASGLGGYTGIVIAAAATAACISAVGAEILSLGPFSVIALTEFSRYFTGTVLASILALIGWIVLSRAGHGYDGRPAGPIASFENDIAKSQKVTLAFLAIPVGWIGIGVITSVVFQALQQNEPQLLINNLGYWISPVIDSAGPGGRYVVIALSAIAGGLLSFLLVR